jgi:hypothetical protein
MFKEKENNTYLKEEGGEERRRSVTVRSEGGKERESGEMRSGQMEKRGERGLEMRRAGSLAGCWFPWVPSQPSADESLTTRSETIRNAKKVGVSFVLELNLIAKVKFWLTNFRFWLTRGTFVWLFVVGYASGG